MSEKQACLTLKQTKERNTRLGLLTQQNNEFAYKLLSINTSFPGLPEVKGFDLTALTQDDLQNLKP